MHPKATDNPKARIRFVLVNTDEKANTLESEKRNPNGQGDGDKSTPKVSRQAVGREKCFCQKTRVFEKN